MNGIPRRAMLLTILLLIVYGIVVWTRPSLWPSAEPNPELAIPARLATSPLAGTAPAQRPRKTINAFHASAAETDPADEARGARCVEEQRRQWLAYRDQLNMQDDSPDKAIAHAFVTLLLSFASSNPNPNSDAGAGAAQEFRAARERWPASLELAWFSMQHCVESRDCDRNAEWRHLRRLDQDNAAVWILAMQFALQRKDEIAYEQALRRAADARFYDLRIGTTFLQVHRLLLSVPVPASCQSPESAAELQRTFGRPPRAEDWAGVQANAIEFAVGLPAFATLSRCKDAEMSTSRRRDCRTLLSRVAQGDTLLEQALAMGLLVQLVGDGPEHAQLRERYRRLQWLVSVMPRLRLSDDYATRMWAEGEVATLQSLATAQGLWPPPPHWLPTDARSRTLIQTGRVPPEQRRYVPRPSPQPQ